MNEAAANRAGSQRDHCEAEIADIRRATETMRQKLLKQESNASNLTAAGSFQGQTIAQLQAELLAENSEVNSLRSGLADESKRSQDLQQDLTHAQMQGNQYREEAEEAWWNAAHDGEQDDMKYDGDDGLTRHSPNNSPFGEGASPRRVFI